MGMGVGRNRASRPGMLLLMAIATAMLALVPAGATFAKATATPGQVRLSGDGNDATCARGRSACRSWERAYSLAQNGDTIDVVGGSYAGAMLTVDQANDVCVAEGQKATFTRTLTLRSAHNLTIVGPIDTAPAFDVNRDFYGLETDGAPEIWSCAPSPGGRSTSTGPRPTSASSEALGGYTETPEAGDSVIAVLGPNRSETRATVASCVMSSWTA